MSLLEERLEQVTDERLKELGFEKCPWGSPDYYSTDSRSNVQRNYTKGERMVGWRPSKYAWILEDGFVTAYYFPDSFTGYANVRGLSTNPKNSIHVFRSHNDSKYVSLTGVQDMMDIENALESVKR